MGVKAFSVHTLIPKVGYPFFGKRDPVFDLGSILCSPVHRSIVIEENFRFVTGVIP
jgi:hypothetical protein